MPQWGTQWGAVNGAQTYLKFSITILALPAAELHELTISDNLFSLFPLIYMKAC